MKAASALARDGAAMVSDVLSHADIQQLIAWTDRALEAGPGARLATAPQALASVSTLAANLTSSATRPVRAVVFDKTASSNWSVAWHQDRTIVVRERIEVAGFGPWSTKRGLLHVAPPVDVLARMITLRVHLDACGPDNAPLKAALGSHRLGWVSAPEAADRVKACEILTCLAEPGDVWAYSTLILHASDRAATPSRRRVIQLDFADFDLPGGLSWRGLDEPF